MTQGYEPWNPGPANEPPPNQQPGYQQPGYQQPGYEQPGYPPSAYPQQPGYEQPTYQQPGYAPGYGDPGFAPQPPPSYGGGYPPAPGGSGGNRGVIIGVVAAVLVIAVGLGVLLVVNRKSSDKAGPTTPTTQVPSTPPTSPLFPTTPHSGPTTPGSTPPSSPASTPPSGTWSDYTSFTDLVGSAPGDTAGAFSDAQCTLEGPLPVDGMLDQIVCDIDNPTLIFAVERFATADDVQSYQTDLIARNYTHVYWTVNSQRVGQELTAPDSVDYLDILSTMCGHPTFMVDFYARKTDTTLTTLHDDYWAKGPFPNDAAPTPCP